MRWTGPTLFVLVTLLAAACGSPPPVPYAQQIQAQRSAKDAAFASDSPESPVPPADRARFLPLAYFPIDDGYHVPARLAPSTGETSLDMPTSTGQRRKMRRVGSLAFTLKGQALTLTAFVEASETDMRRLFVPFGDLTNGSETYQGGRYLDLDRTASGVYDLDFNRAYHPYCYFNDEYDCPFPPAENRLGIPIRAGERMKGAHASN